jgi:transcriptional regulator with XRE-family HTH domain
MTLRNSPSTAGHKTKGVSIGSASGDLATGSNAPVEAPSTVEERLGREIRKLRRRLGLTGAELSRAANISTGMLSKIETGQISPSLTTVEAIASALNVPIAALFTMSGTKRDCSHVRRGAGVVINRRGTKAGHRYELLGHSLSGDVAMEPYLITLAKDAKPYTAFQHAGMELIYMLTGRVTYRHEDHLYELNPGDALFFDANGMHGPEVLSKLPSTYLSIIVYPRP